MRNRMLQPFEPEELWLQEWPFRNLFPSSHQSFGTSGISAWEEKDHIMIEVALPGMKKEDVELVFERGVLTIRAERKETEEDKDRKYFQRANHSFLYRLTVPGELDEVAEPEAKLRDGMLLVRFKKHKKATPRTISVQAE